MNNQQYIKNISVEVAYALPEKQRILVVEVSAGTTAVDAVRLSGISNLFPEIHLEDLKLGVFGKSVSLDREVFEGDRIEIYRPLIADPKASRQARAAKAKAARK